MTIFHKVRRRRPVNFLLITAIQLLPIYVVAQEEARQRESLVVTAARMPAEELNTVGNISSLSAEQIGLNNAIHPYELAVQVPGVWVGRGSGQEHLTAIRSPVLTGAGSCGAFLIMEDNIPTRPTGFCNVNQMFEVPTVLADRIEVIRGPANSYYGSNGLHGAVNTLLPEPGSSPGSSLSVETGSNDYWRGEALWDSGPGESAWNAGLVYDRDGGYRSDSGYNQAKFYAKNRHETSSGLLSFNLSGSWLDQETAGFITGEDAYKESGRFRNENPEAYRDAHSVRTSAIWTPDPGQVWAPEYRFFMRYSDMDFLMHFLPGQPKEKNDQFSGGFGVITRRDIGEASNLTLGFDGELARGSLEQFQENPPPGFATNRPQGQQYDYDVNSYTAAAFASITTQLNDRWELQAGLRAEYTDYDYDNRMIAGNTDANGGDCPGAVPPGSGGCLYSRPEDRTDDFFDVAPNAGLLYRFNEETVGFINAVRGFRVPQATELYRLQQQQEIADIDTVEIDSLETGVRHAGSQLNLEAVAFYMKKRNDILRDSAGFNIDNGKTKHYGIETNVNWRIIDPVYLDIVASYSRQKYDFDEDAGLGETIEKGNDVDTAPRILGSARLGYEYGSGIAELEWVYMDDYYLDAANTEKYNGHNLLNARFTFEASDTWSFALRVTNLTDDEYADRADLFSATPTPQFRYFPGHEREVYAQVTWRTD